MINKYLLIYIAVKRHVPIYNNLHIYKELVLTAQGSGYTVDDDNWVLWNVSLKEAF